MEKWLNIPILMNTPSINKKWRNRIWLNKRKNKIVPEVRISTFILPGYGCCERKASILDDLHGFFNFLHLNCYPFYGIILPGSVTYSFQDVVS